MEVKLHPHQVGSLADSNWVETNLILYNYLIENPIDCMLDREDEHVRDIEICIFTDRETYYLEIDAEFPLVKNQMFDFWLSVKRRGQDFTFDNRKNYSNGAFYRLIFNI